MRVVPLNCYYCGQPSKASCARCGRWFCSTHGDGMCRDCLAPLQVLPSPLLFNVALLSLVVLVALAGWFLFWPPPKSFEVKATVGEFPGELEKGETSFPGATLPQGAALPSGESTPTFSPTPSPTITPTPQEQLYYIVVPGDVLSSIAAKFGVSTEAIMAANHMENPHMLSIGQRLLIPRG